MAQRIKKAKDEDQLLPDLAALADEVRLGRNSAAHDDEPIEQEDAELPKDYSELLLTYLFTIPGKLNEAKEKAVARKREEPAHRSS